MRSRAPGPSSGSAAPPPNVRTQAPIKIFPRPRTCASDRTTGAWNDLLYSSHCERGWPAPSWSYQSVGVKSDRDRSSSRFMRLNSPGGFRARTFGKACTLYRSACTAAQARQRTDHIVRTVVYLPCGCGVRRTNAHECMKTNPIHESIISCLLRGRASSAQRGQWSHQPSHGRQRPLKADW